jgi:integrase
MGKLSDVQIRQWMKTGERFDMRSDGDGLYLSFREDYAIPVWKFRYRFAGKARVMNLGSYSDLSLADARKTAKELRARVALGHDVAAEKQERKAEAVANDVLRWTRRMFDFAVKRHMAQYNPASAFDLSDAGGKEEARERALSREELVLLFEAMRTAKGFSHENLLAVKLLLVLAVRKQELTGARWAEFDLDKAVWYLPAERTKTETAIDIPLPSQAIEALRDLHRLACGSEWVFPARKAQHRMIPHIHENTLNVALSKVKPLMPGAPSFCVHDLRRTAR